jgi:hypothetical protein
MLGKDTGGAGDVGADTEEPCDVGAPVPIDELAATFTVTVYA